MGEIPEPKPYFGVDEYHAYAKKHGGDENIMVKAAMQFFADSVIDMANDASDNNDLDLAQAVADAAGFYADLAIEISDRISYAIQVAKQVERDHEPEKPSGLARCVECDCRGGRDEFQLYRRENDLLPVLMCAECADAAGATFVRD